MSTQFQFCLSNYLQETDPHSPIVSKPTCSIVSPTSHPHWYVFWLTLSVGGITVHIIILTPNHRVVLESSLSFPPENLTSVFPLPPKSSLTLYPLPSLNWFILYHFSSDLLQGFNSSLPAVLSHLIHPWPAVFLNVKILVTFLKPFTYIYHLQDKT